MSLGLGSRHALEGPDTGARNQSGSHLGTEMHTLRGQGCKEWQSQVMMGPDSPSHLSELPEARRYSLG